MTNTVHVNLNHIERALDVYVTISCAYVFRSAKRMEQKGFLKAREHYHSLDVVVCV